jgi:hypothetical protein
MASIEVSRPLHGSGGMHGTSEQCEITAGLRHFSTPRVSRLVQVIKYQFNLLAIDAD